MHDLDAALAAARSRYEGWLAEHGPGSSRAVGWNEPELQAVRFDVLCQVMDGTEPVSVADLGCGVGALFTHLAARTAPPPLGSYTGYDIVPAMVDAARAAIDDPRARFVVGSEVTEEADYVMASGTLTIRPGVGDDEWAAHVRATLRRLWTRARRGLAFNMLSSAIEYSNPEVFSADPEEWATWCMRELPGAGVAVRQGPPLEDFAILVRRVSDSFS
jgi:SAM-dependent methyltransferase